MPVPRAQLGGPFNSGFFPPTSHPVDIGDAIQGAVSGASTLIQGAYLRKIAQQRLAVQQQSAQAVADWREAMAAQRNAQAQHTRDLQSPEFQQAFATALDETADPQTRNLARAKVLATAPEYAAHVMQPAKPSRTRYDAGRGVMIDEDAGTATPIAGLPPAPTKDGQAHYDERRGVFVHPDGTVTPVKGLPPPIETPSEQRGAASAARADAAATRADQALGVSTSKGALDEALRGVPRPSIAAKAAAAPIPNLKQAAAAGQAAFNSTTADSLAYEQSTLRPARLRYSNAVNAVAPAAPPPGRLRTPGPGTGTALTPQDPAMQQEFDAAAARYRQHAQNPAIPQDQLRAAYSQDLTAIAKKYGAVP